MEKKNKFTWNRFHIGLVLLIVFPAVIADAATLEVNPDSGLLRVDNGSFASSVSFNGSIIEAAVLYSGVCTYRVHGDFNVHNSDIVTATGGSTQAVRFLVGNDANISAGSQFNFSANGTVSRAGGGTGGTGGEGGDAQMNVGGGHFTMSFGGGNNYVNNGGSRGGIAGGDGGNGQTGVDGDTTTLLWDFRDYGSSGYAGGMSGAGGAGVNGGGGGAAVSGGDGGVKGVSPLENQYSPLDYGEDIIVFDYAKSGAASFGGDYGNGGPGGAKYSMGGLGGGPGGAGGDAHDGDSGGNGGLGGDGYFGFNGLNTGGDSLTLVGGGGGSGGSGGGSGGSGAGGGPGGGGGGGGSGGGGGGGGGALTGKGGAGGRGGAGGGGGRGGSGGDGGIGGAGGDGGLGGGGGGAFEIIALGRINLNGTLNARGGSGSDGQMYSPGGLGTKGTDGSAGGHGYDGEKGGDGNEVPGGRGGYGHWNYVGEPESYGSAGNNDAYEFLDYNNSAGGGGGGAGGPGGKGGDGGYGGDGGSGGWGFPGGGGAGGTVSVIGSVTRGAGQIDTSGGGSGSEEGGKGRLILGDNIGGGLQSSVSQAGVGNLIGTTGSRSHNPFLFDNWAGTLTPNIPGLRGGAEAFGLLDGIDPATLPLFDGVRNTLSLMRFDNLLGENINSLDYDFQDFDTILLANLNGFNIRNPKLGFGSVDVGDIYNLSEGGWANDVFFGGSGDIFLDQLAAGDVYSLLIPESVSSFYFAADGWASGQNVGSIRNGESHQITPIPVPGSLSLLSTGLIVIIGLRRKPKRNHRHSISL